MSLWTKLFKAVQGAATEVGEDIVDSQALRILDQEIRDASSALQKAKTNLTSMMAEQRGTERQVNRLRDGVREHEGYAIAAMNKGEQSLAEEVAAKIAEMESEQQQQQGLLDNYTQHIEQLRNNIRTTERNLDALRRKSQMVKTTENVQKAQSAIASRFSGGNSAMRSATDSLERIQKRQQLAADQMQAAAELEQDSSGSDLNSRLSAVGIGQQNTSTQSVLERLKASNRLEQG